MTLNGAIMQLVVMRENSMMPVCFKPYFDKVIETISECEEPSAQPDYKTDHGFMWLCPKCGLPVHSDFEKCVRCGYER